MIRARLVVVYGVCMLLFSGCANTASTELIESGWEAECAGYYQFFLPGDVDIALSDMKDVFSVDPSQVAFKFSDRTRALFSKLVWGHGVIHVTETQSEAVFKSLELEMDEMMEERKYPEKSVYKQSWPKSFAWISPSSANINLFREGRIYTNGIGQTPDQSTLHVDRFVKNFITRQLFEIPDKRGVCIPYGFVAGEAEQPRKIAVTLRLKEHPDVEIYFKDESASEPRHTTKGRLIDRDAEEEIREFVEWDYHSYAARAEADSRGFHSITMAGREGKAIFMTITRKRGETDYGYVAYVKGDHKADKDKPNLMLYVMRTAAKAKGAPVSREELREIAEKIVASVKRRVPDNP